MSDIQKRKNPIRAEWTDAERRVRRHTDRQRDKLIERARVIASRHAGDVAYDIGRYIAESDDSDLSRGKVARSLKIEWYITYRVVRVRVCQRFAGEHSPLIKPVRSDVIGQGRQKDYPPDARERAAEVYNSIVTKAAPSLEVETSLAICDGPCSPMYGLKNDDPVMWYPHSPTLCKRFGDHWLCKSCREPLMLEPTDSGSNEDDERSHAQRERDKMSPGLRFDVFKRDDFTCQSCGRTPQEDDVKLHADHIKPVSKGGETEMGNLQALCADCNRGKSDKRCEQMEMV